MNLNEIQERHAAATPGPWQYVASNEIYPEIVSTVDARSVVEWDLFECAREDFPRPGDVQFLTHSWSDIRDLLAVAKAADKLANAADQGNIADSLYVAIDNYLVVRGSAI